MSIVSGLQHVACNTLQEVRQGLLIPATAMSSAAESLQAPMQTHSGTPLGLQASPTKSPPLR